MNYETAYKEALERAKKELQTCGSTDCDAARQIFRFFPELKESEDEQHRKWILEYLYDGLRKSDEQFKDQFKSAIAWLEKQGEKPIPENINEAALQYVDTCAVDGEVTHDNITEPYWNNHSMMKAYKAGWLEKQGEQKPAWSEEDELMQKEAVSIVKQYDLICKKEGDKCWAADSVIDWLKSLKPQPKQEWSEEDEKTIDEAISLINMLASGYGEKVTEPITFNGVKMINNIKEWLRNLHQKRNHWKPSEQNIKDLEWCADLVKDKMGVGFHRLQVFIDEIKKL